MGLAFALVACTAMPDARAEDSVTTIIFGERSQSDMPDPITADEYRWRGLGHYAHERYEQALSDFTTAIKLQPHYAPPVAERGDTYLKLGRIDEAIDDFNRAIELVPQLTGAYLSRADAYCRIERYTNCIKDLDAALNLDPQDTKSMRKRSDIQWRLGHYGNALGGYFRAFSIGARSYFSAVASNLGRALLAALNETVAVYFEWHEDYERAILHYSAAIRFEPFRYPYRYYHRGWAYISEGRPDQAVGDFSLVLALTPNDAAAKRARAVAYQHQGKLDLAIKDLAALIKTDPANPGYYVSHAYVLGLAANHEAAKLSLEKALDLAPESAWVHNGWGYHHLRTGKLEAARQSFERAIALSPEFGGYHHSAGVYHSYAGDNQAADREWRKACSQASEFNTRSWQRELKRLGHYEGQIDGICGDRMIAAFRSCAKAKCPF